VNENFDLEPSAEVSLEANPGTVDLEKLRALRSMGVNRLSLGAQSFDDARLKAFNRNHNAAQTYEAFEWARRAGFVNINLDLIYGLPDQTLAEWSATLDRTLDFQSEHLSLYGLQVEDGTALARQIAQARVRAPDDDLAAEMYLLAEEKLDAAGFIHYEISNWARRGDESRHNMTYWLNKPYLGFGAGAHSYFRGARYENVRLPNEYISRLGRAESVVAKSEVISHEMEMAETMMLGLRLGQGISFADFAARFGVDARTVYADSLDLLQAWELMRSDEERTWLTPRGRLVSNQVLWRFLPEGV
jgi:oxygen-independent coproporphyrinogen-3 oxidase